MVHVVRTANHVLVNARGLTVGGIPGSVLVLVGEAIPLPVVQLVILLPLDGELLELLNITTVSDVDVVGARSLGAIIVSSEDVGHVILEVIAATRTNPGTKVGTESLNQLTRGGKTVRELGVELPEAGLVLANARLAHINRAVGRIVVVPAIVHNVVVQRTNAVLNKILVDCLKGIEDVLVVDIHHVVEPGVVLNTELRGNSDVIDVIEEIGLDHTVVRAASGAGNRLPRLIRDYAIVFVGLTVKLETLQRLARVVAGTGVLLAILIDDLRISLGELAAKEHAIRIEGLTEVRLELLHLDDATLTERNRPLGIASRDIKGLEVDVVNLGIRGLVLGNGDLHVLAHVVIAVIGNDVLGDGVIHTVELYRLELEGQLLARLLLLVNGSGGIRLDRLALGKSKVTRLEEHPLLDRLNVLLGVKIELLATGELVVVHVGDGNKLDKAHILAQLNLAVVDVDVNCLALVARVVELTFCNLGPTLVGLHIRSSLGRAYPKGVFLDVAIDFNPVIIRVSRIISEASKRRRGTEINYNLMRHTRLLGKILTSLVLIRSMPNGVGVVINQTLRQTVASSLSDLFLGIGSRGPTGLVDRPLTDVFRLGALDDKFLAALFGNQLRLRTAVVDPNSLQLAVGDREGTGDCIVANGDLLTIHIRECIPPPLYPLGSAKAAIGSDDTVITTVIAPIAQRFSHGLLIYLLSCCVASI